MIPDVRDLGYYPTYLQARKMVAEIMHQNERVVSKTLVRLAEEILKREREACAKIADSYITNHCMNTAEEVAESIRAQSNR